MCIPQSAQKQISGQLKNGPNQQLFHEKTHDFFTPAWLDQSLPVVFLRPFRSTIWKS